MAAALLTGVTFVPASPLARAGSAVNQFGMHGVLEVPSARMPREAELTASVSRQDVADIYSIAYQPLPWLEVGYRYTIFDPRCEDSQRRCDGLRDRSFEVKARLLSETRWRPQVAVGLRDIAGTGAWGAEYVAASKRIGNLDLTLGVGWGRLAERAVAENPLIRISERFAQRDSEFGLGGTLSWGDYFFPKYHHFYRAVFARFGRFCGFRPKTKYSFPTETCKICTFGKLWLHTFL